MSRSDQQKRSRKENDRTSSDSDDDRKSNDKKWLKNLSEREREAELLKRHEEHERLKHHEDIRKRLKSQGKQTDLLAHVVNDTESKTRSNELDNDIYADDDDDEDRSFSNRRQHNNASKQKETERCKTLQFLTAERKKKQEEKAKKLLPKRADSASNDDNVSLIMSKEKLEVKDVYSPRSSDSESDSSERNRSRSPIEKSQGRKSKSTSITAKVQLKSMILTRYRMEKWCHAPFFSDVAKGAFVRINIGQNNGTPIYRICEIRDVVETSKIYNLGSTRTNKGLRLKHGNHERVFRLEFISNKEISDSEFTRWRNALLKKGIALPTLHSLDEKMKQIDQFKKRQLNNHDISQIVAEKNRFRKAPTNYARMKNELLKEIEVAKDENNIRKATELRKKLQETEEQASELDRKRTLSISAMAQINERNRKETQQNIEMAIARQEHQDRAADPFTRRRCEPTLVSRAPQTRDDLIRELKTRRAADEAAALAVKRKQDEQRATEKEKSKQQTILTTSDFNQNEALFLDHDVSMLRTRERGSFATFSDKTDELFNSHNFELDVPIQLLPE